MRWWDKRKHFGERGKWTRKDIYHLMLAQHPNHTYFLYFLIFEEAGKEREYIIRCKPSTIHVLYFIFNGILKEHATNIFSEEYKRLQTQRFIKAKPWSIAFPTEKDCI